MISLVWKFKETRQKTSIIVSKFNKKSTPSSTKYAFVTALSSDIGAVFHGETFAGKCRIDLWP